MGIKYQYYSCNRDVSYKRLVSYDEIRVRWRDRFKNASTFKNYDNNKRKMVKNYI